MSAPAQVRGFWLVVARWCVDNRLAVFIGTGLVALLGLAFAPFQTDLGPVPRDPVPVDVLPEVGENPVGRRGTWRIRSPIP